MKEDGELSSPFLLPACGCNVASCLTPCLCLPSAPAMCPGRNLPALGKQRQKDNELEASLRHTASPSQNKTEVSFAS